jgi:hypothetical protein
MDTLTTYQDQRLRAVCASQRADAAAMCAEARRMADRAAEMMEHAQSVRGICNPGGRASASPTSDSVP